MLVLENEDVPGMIGRVGTILGNANVNIANMNVSRNQSGGNALMVVSIDEEPTSGAALRARGDEGRRDAAALHPPGLSRTYSRPATWPHGRMVSRSRTPEAKEKAPCRSPRRSG